MWFERRAPVARKTTDPKVEALAAQRSLNPRPEAVVDEAFSSSEFLDPRDLVQVKYEMVRRVRVEGHTVVRSAAQFGFSRPAFYDAAAALDASGLPGHRSQRQWGQRLCAIGKVPRGRSAKLAGSWRRLRALVAVVTAIAAVVALLSGATYAPASTASGKLPAGASISWARAQAVPGSQPLARVSCASETFCVALDQTGQTFIWDGSGWSRSVALGQPNEPQISCASSRFCLVATSGGEIWDGSRWTGPVLKSASPGEGGLTAVSCRSATWCMLGDTGSNAAGSQSYFAQTWNGSGLTAPVTVDPDGSFFSISCSSRRFCAAVDERGIAFTWNGQKWSGMALRGIGPTHNWEAVSCAAGAFCVATAETGQISTWNGVKWSAGTVIGQYAQSFSVSCPSDKFCVAQYDDPPDNAIVWDGVTWSKELLPGMQSLGAVSCPTIRFCMAVGGSGQVGYAQIGR
jgi:hypothetical protein